MTPDAREIIDSLGREMTNLQYLAVGTSPTEQRLANAIACLCSVLLAETGDSSSARDTQEKA